MTLSLRRNYLPGADAEELCRIFETATDWRLLEDSEQHFQPFEGDLMPKGDELYWTKFLSSEALTVHPAVLRVTKQLNTAWHRCYRMDAGHGLRMHEDAYFGGKESHSLYLTRKWRWDWGGLLHVLNESGDTCETACPEFNMLATMNYETAKVPHFVSTVQPWAQQPRYVLAMFGEAP